MRYFLAAALAVVMVLPPANVQAGDEIGPDTFIVLGAAEDLGNESVFCGSLSDPNVWLLATFDDDANIDTAYIGTDAKVSTKGGVRMKQKAKSANGNIRLLSGFPEARPGRGPAPTEENVEGSMTAKYNPKNLTFEATVVDKTNDTTVESPGSSPIQAYLVSNLAFFGEEGCQGIIDQIEAGEVRPQSLRGLLN